MDDTNKTPPSGLDALAGMTQQLDRENTPQTPEEKAKAEEAKKKESGAREWAQIPRMIGGLAAMIEPQLAQFYTAQACMEWGKAAHATAEKYELKSPSNLPELALISSTIGFALPTFLLVRARVQQLRQAQDGSMLDKLRLWWSERGKKKAADKAAKADKPAKGGEVVEAGAVS